MAQSFTSKVDTWLVLVIVIPVIAVLVAIGTVRGDPELTVADMVVMLALPLVLGFGLPLWIFRSTSYTIGSDHLTVRSGPLKVVIPISAISRVAATRSIESAPALSLDRLAVEYGKGKRVLISPSDKPAFLKALTRAGLDEKRCAKALSLVMLALLAHSAPLGAQKPTPPIIEVRIAVTRATPGYVPRQLGDSTFHVSDSVLFSDADIRRADTTWSEGVLSLRIRLTSQAQARVAEMTKAHVGDRVAIFLNGEFTEATIVVSPLVGPVFGMETFGPPKALALAEQVVARWPRRR